MGSYKCQIMMPIKRKVVGIDYCISHIVAALNAGGLSTVASCCGHGKVNGSIVLDNGLVMSKTAFLNLRGLGKLSRSVAGRLPY